jgi:TetR/AcrR family transcriptional repressor of nem operon
MRKSRQEAAATRARIVKSAASEFRENGISGTGLDNLMAAAGLTHGGFYRHFESKDQVVAEACSVAFAELAEQLAAAVSVGGLEALVTEYLSPRHRDNPADGCPFAALGSEIARSNDELRAAATEGFMKVVDVVAGQFKRTRPDLAKQRAVVAMSTMIGALTMSRIVTDPDLSTAILQQTRKHLAHA